MKIGDKVKTTEGDTMIVVSSPTSKVVRLSTEPGVEPYAEVFRHVDELSPARKAPAKKAAAADKKPAE